MHVGCQRAGAQLTVLAALASFLQPVAALRPPGHRGILLERAHGVDLGAFGVLAVQHEANASYLAADGFREDVANASYLTPNGFRHEPLGDADQTGRLEADVPATLARDELRGHGVLDSNHGIAGAVLVPGWGGFLLCMLVGAGFSQWRPVSAIPMSAWTIFVSCIGGLMLRAMLVNGVITGEWYMRTSSTFLNLGLLPVIIFASGWQLNHLNFISQLEHIAIFAVFGTLLAFLFVGITMTTLGVYEFHMINDSRSNFVFAALISAVDPVATLSTLARLGLDASQPLLHTMIFGESVVNDAVAIVLFKALNHGVGTPTWWQVAYDITKLLFGSWILGHVVSCLLIFALRCARLPGDTVPETLYIVGSAWFIFAVAEGFHLSGIIANLWAGTMFKMYGAQLLQAEGVELTSHFLEVAAEMCDTMVFMLCGVSSALVTSFKAVRFAMFALVLCLIGRAMSTSACAAISNALKTMVGAPANHRLTAAHQIMMWHAGLRGGIALVLALEVDADWCHYKATIINTTFMIIVVYLLVFGSTTEVMLKAFDFSGNGNGNGAGSQAEGEEAEEHQGTQSPVANTSPMAMTFSTAEGHALLWTQVQEHNKSNESLKIRLIRRVNDVQEWLLVGDFEVVAERQKKAHDHWVHLQEEHRRAEPAQDISLPGFGHGQVASIRDLLTNRPPVRRASSAPDGQPEGSRALSSPLW